ncbi:MAG: hypothetical protein WCR67_07740 [Bacilli bacterium]
MDEHSYFTEDDLCGVVHVVDLDGAFTPDEIIKGADVEKVQYYCDKIEIRSENIDKLKFSRQSKRKILEHLSSIDTIIIPKGKSVPYSIYYMSCNLDHVLHQKMNSTNREKQDDSFSFSDEYDDPEKFENFFNNDEIKIPGSYKETWDYVKKDYNSLKRGSNFWICINKYKDN